MAYCDFLSSLFGDGRVLVDLYQPLSGQAVAAGDAVLTELEQTVRLEAPGEPPPLVLQAARWASIRFYRASQFAVYRDLPPERLDEELAQPFAEPVTPAVHYSVDIVMRYLPDLLKFAASASENDPLIEHLMRWVRDWPLSSVGVADVGDVSIDGFTNDPSILQLYTDRVIAADDETRLSDPRVAAAVRSAFGMFPEIGGKLAKSIEKDHTQEFVA